MRMTQLIYRATGLATLSLCLATCQSTFAASLPIVKDVEGQPFAAQIKRLIEATDYLGSPLSAKDKAAIEAVMKETDLQSAGEKLQARSG